MKTSVNGKDLSKFFGVRECCQFFFTKPHRCFESKDHRFLCTYPSRLLIIMLKRRFNKNFCQWFTVLTSSFVPNCLLTFHHKLFFIVLNAIKRRLYFMSSFTRQEIIYPKRKQAAGKNEVKCVSTYPNVTHPSATYIPPWQIPRYNSQKSGRV